MKKTKFAPFLLLFCFLCSVAKASEFTAKISHVNATGFPVIEAMMQVYFPEPLDLKPENLRLEENNKRVENFSLTSQQFKHYMVLAIDRSSSIETAMPDVKKAAASLIKNLADHVQISIVSFGSDFDIDHSFSSDEKSLIEAIEKMRPWGGTALFDALYESCEELQAAAGLNDLKTIVCLTDGRDSTPSGQTQLSKRDQNEVNKYAVDKGIRIINLGLGDEIDPVFLEGLASATSGWYLQTATSDQLTRLCEELSQRIKLKRHYRLVYNSSTTVENLQSRTLKVVIEHNGQKAESTRGYFPPARATSQAMSLETSSSQLSFEDLLEHFEIAGADRVMLIGKLRLPVPEPVHGLTLAVFKDLSEANCLNLINQASQKLARQHQQNFDARKNYLDKYLGCVDRLLGIFYQKAEATGVKQTEAEKIARFIAFLDLRRNELETLNQKVYEQYLVNFKATEDELAYFEKTQVRGEKFDEGFFAQNNASQTRALEMLENKYTDKLVAIQEKRGSFSNSPEMNKQPASSEKGLDLSLPQLPGIKALD